MSLRIPSLVAAFRPGETPCYKFLKAKPGEVWIIQADPYDPRQHPLMKVQILEKPIFSYDPVIRDVTSVGSEAWILLTSLPLAYVTGGGQEIPITPYIDSVFSFHQRWRSFGAESVSIPVRHRDPNAHFEDVTPWNSVVWTDRRCRRVGRAPLPTQRLDGRTESRQIFENIRDKVPSWK